VNRDREGCPRSIRFSFVQPLGSCPCVSTDENNNIKQFELYLRYLNSVDKTGFTSQRQRNSIYAMGKKYHVNAMCRSICIYTSCLSMETIFLVQQYMRYTAPKTIICEYNIFLINLIDFYVSTNSTYFHDTIKAL
jgi:hypothetical protein